MKHRVVHVRGTPTSGKTVLSELINSHVEEYHKELVPVYVVWETRSTRAAKSWQDFLCNYSQGRVSYSELYARSDILWIIDEAQLSYTEPDFWIRYVKRQSSPGKDVGPRLVLFSSFGSPSASVFVVPGSSPVTLEPEQRMSLTIQPHLPHDLALCFSPEEILDLAARIIGKRSFTIQPSVLEYLLELTNGHPGLCQGLLLSLLDQDVCTPTGP